VGLTVYEGYGLTETSPIVTANFPGRRRLGSVGRPIAGVRVVIDRKAAVDGDGDNGGGGGGSNGGGGGKEGEIIVYGPNVMVGYHKRPDENEKALAKDGGLRTGDLGYLDDDGYLFITGRIKEQYKLENGKYVMPSPLEEELKLSPYVANAMLFGDGRPFNVALVVINESAIRGWAESEGIVLGEDKDPTQDERVRSLLRDEIALHAQGFKSFERPREIALIREDFTTENGFLTPTLKLRRREVLSRYGALIGDLYASSETKSVAVT
jgi:long-chain acyl-CoA synthetase